MWEVKGKSDRWGEEDWAEPDLAKKRRMAIDLLELEEVIEEERRKRGRRHPHLTYALVGLVVAIFSIFLLANIFWFFVVWLVAWAVAAIARI